MELAQERDRWLLFMNGVMNIQVLQNARNFLASGQPVSFSSKSLLRGINK